MHDQDNRSRHLFDLHLFIPLLHYVREVFRDTFQQHLNNINIFRIIKVFDFISLKLAIK